MQQFWLSCGNGWVVDIGAPPTELQKHIARMITFLREEYGSSGEFNAAIMRAMERARALEDQRDNLLKELAELKQSLALAPPAFKLETFTSKPTPEQPIARYSLRVRTDLPEWHISIGRREEAIARAEIGNKASRVMRWRTYLAFSRAVRKRVEQAFFEFNLT